MLKRKFGLIAVLLACVMSVSGVFVGCGNSAETKTNYTVTFDSDGGSAVAQQTVEAGKTATKPTNPTKTGFGFGEWQLNGVAYDFGAAVNANITLKATWRKLYDNETQPLVLQTSTLDGVFNPFFASSAYDIDVVGLVYRDLFTVSPAGEIVAGDEYATIAKSYDVSLDDNEGTATYTIVLKNGLKFSDGSAITADDVLFNYYVYLDPKYDGNSTLYTTPIKGLSEFRNQTDSESVKIFASLANLAWNLGSELSESEFEALTEGTEDENGNVLSYSDYMDYWGCLQEAGEKFAGDIVNYVVANYASYIPSYLHPSIGKMNDTQKVALGMAMWGFGKRTSDLYSEAADGDYVKLDAAYEAYDENNADHNADDTEYFNMVAYNENADGEGAYAQYKGKMYTTAVLDKNGIAYDTTYDLVENPVFADRDDYAVWDMVATDYDDMGNPEIGDYVRIRKAGYYKFDANDPAHTADGVKRYALSTSCIFETGAGKEVDILAANASLTLADYWDALCDAYGTDYADMSDTETANVGLEDFLKDLFIPIMVEKAGGAAVPSISGITKGTTEIDGVDYETITIVCTAQSPKTILNLGQTIAPKAYYTNGWNYTTDAIVNAGVEFNNADFMAHLKTKNSTPMGAGPYKFVKYENNVVEFERNTYFETFGLGNAKIKYVRMQVISSGQEYAAVKTGTVYYATVSATADVVSEVATINNLTSILVDNLGYGYICVNPAVYKNVNTRIALQTLFDISQVYEYYPNGLAEIIYRSMSKVSWAYPEDATAVYAYDATKAKAREYFAKAGYTWEDGVMIDPATGEQAVFTMTLPSGAADHPAGKIFQNAKTLLDSLGAKGRVAVDTNLLNNVKNGDVGVYSIAWGSTLDPDMTQVYSMDSQANSVDANGISYIKKHAAEFGESAGKITFKGKEYTQYEAMQELTRLIAEGLTYMMPADRKPIYNDILDLLAQLAIEIPTYQRKNMFVYDNTVIDADTLSSDITPYWGPIAEIWKLSLVVD